MKEKLWTLYIINTEKPSNKNKVYILGSWYSRLNSVLLADGYVALPRTYFCAVPDCRRPYQPMREVKTNPKTKRQ